MLKLRNLEISYPHQLFLKISAREQKQAWIKAQSYSNPTAQCQGYLNYLCWHTLIPWLETWIEEDRSQNNNSKNCRDKSIIPESSLPELWEFVNGSIVNYRGIRLALIPSETTELEEFDIPQEWVDIPQWQADYYLAIQINLDVSEEAWMRILGYVSYSQLREKGKYDESDRCYYVENRYLEEDITEILLEPQLSIEPRQKSVMRAELPFEKAEMYLAELAEPIVYYPRLAIPFQQWQLLITNDEWRRKLYRTRNGQLTGHTSPALEVGGQPLTKLRTWLKNIATEITQLATEARAEWQMLDFLALDSVEPSYARSSFSRNTVKDLITLLEPNNSTQVRSHAAGLLGKIGANNLEVRQALAELLETATEEKLRWEAALSLGKIDPDNPHAGIAKGKVIDLGIELASQKIILLVAIAPEKDGRIKVWLQVKSANSDSKLPPYLKLKVISSAKVLLMAESRSYEDSKGKDDCIQLSFTPPVETEFTVEITLNNASFTEKFQA